MTWLSILLAYMSISAIKLDLALSSLAYVSLRPIRPDLALDSACMGGRGCGLQGKEQGGGHSVWKADAVASGKGGPHPTFGDGLGWNKNSTIIRINITSSRLLAVLVLVQVYTLTGVEINSIGFPSWQMGWFPELVGWMAALDACMWPKVES